jgi:hypothetical protein
MTTLDDLASRVTAPLANTTDPTKGAALVGFQQNTPGGQPRDVADRFSDNYTLFDAMTKAQKASAKARDLSVDMTDAVQRAINDGYHFIHVPASALRIDGTVEGGSDVTFVGDGDFKTNFVLTGSNPGFIFSSGFSQGGSASLQRIGFRDMCFTQQGTSNSILFTGAMNVGMNNVRFLGGQDFQLRLEQVFDSYFEKVYFASTTGAVAALAVRSGTADCSNNLRFNNCTWEQLNAGAIKSVTELGGLENYSYAFNNCKWERCNISGTATSWISMFPASGSRAHVSVDFQSPIFAFDDDTTSLLFYGDTISQLTIDNAQVTAQNTHSAALMSLQTTVLTKINGLYMSMPNLVNTSYVPILNTGTNTNLDVSNVFLNNSAVYQAVQTTGEWITHSSQRIRNPAGLFQTFDQPNVGTYSTSIESGQLTTRSSQVGGNPVVTVAANGRFLPNYGVSMPSSAWNGAAFRVDAYYLWFDGTTAMRYKQGAPTSDLDGAALIPRVTAPASSSATGIRGQFAFDNNYVYVCTNTNTWVRAALSTW